MAASALGNIHVRLLVDTGNARNFTSAANVIGRDSDRMRRALGGTNHSVTALRASMSQGWRSRIFSDMIRQASQTNNEVAKLRATMMGLAAITGTSITGAFAGTFLLQTADQSNRLNNNLRTVTESEENLIAVRQKLYEVSQRSRSDLQSTVTLYARVARAAEDFGKSQTELVRVAETVQKAFAIGGATQAEATGGAIQLSQGIASDRFSGEEYRSVAENAPVLLREMGRQLGVNIGKLREMAHAGELTGKVVTDAILGASAAIDQDFNKTIVTVGQGLTRVGNAFLMYIGESDASVGATRRLSEGLSNLAENFDEIAPWITGAAFAGATFFGGRAAGGALTGLTANLLSNTKAARENAAAIMSGNAVALNSARSNELRTRAVRETATASLQSTKAAVAAGQADAAALKQTLALTQAQHAKAIASVEVNRGIVEATGRTGLYNKALANQQAALRAMLGTKLQLRSIEASLATNTALLATQTGAAAVATTAHNAALAATTVRARAAAASLTALKTASTLATRSFFGLVGVLGGPMGIAFMAAIVGIGLYASNAAKASERTDRFKKELHALGLISDDVAGIFETTAESIEDLGAATIRTKLRDIADELERIKGSQNIFDQIFAYDPASLGNIIQQLERVQSGFTADGRGVNTMSPDQLAAADTLSDIAVAARDGTATVEDLQARLESLARNDTDMPWLDTMIENLQRAIPYMDGLQTRAEQLDSQLSSMGESGVSTGWIDNLVAQQDTLAAVQAGAETARQLADEQMRVLALSEEEAALEKIKTGLRKDAKDALEDGQTIYEANLDLVAREILAAEKVKEAREAAAKAQEDFNSKVADLTTEIDDATSSFEDMQAAATIKRLLEDFATGNMKVETLKDRLAEVNSVNLSDPMDKLIDKIIAAIGPLAQLLGIFNSFGSGTSPLGGDLSGPSRPGGALGRSRRELQAKQGIGQKVLDSAIADAGLSERDAWIKDKAEDLQKQAAALGGVATNAETTAASLWEMEEAQKAAEKSGKGAADAAEKYAEAMAELQRELAAAPLEPFLKEVLAAGEGMGIATDELDAFVAAVSSGGLAAAPAKFREIAAAMQEIKAIGALNDLEFERSQMFRSGTEQNVVSALQEMGLTESDPYGEMIAGQIRLNDALKEGRDVSSEFFGGMASDLLNGATFTDALASAFNRLGARLVQMGMDAAINALFGNLVGAFGGNFMGGSMGAPSLKLGFQSGIPGYAVGTNDHPGGLARVFERGAEIIDLPKHTRVIPHELSKSMASAQSAASDSSTFHFAPNIDARGADTAAVEKLGRTLAKMQNEFEGRVKLIVKNRSKNLW